MSDTLAEVRDIAIERSLVDHSTAHSTGDATNDPLRSDLLPFPLGRAAHRRADCRCPHLIHSGGSEVGTVHLQPYSILEKEITRRLVDPYSNNRPLVLWAAVINDSRLASSITYLLAGNPSSPHLPPLPELWWCIRYSSGPHQRSQAHRRPWQA